MKYEVQVHFENQGQLVWQQDSDQPEAFLESLKGDIIIQDKPGCRWLYFNMKTVTAIIMIDKEEQSDPIRRLYAPSERTEPENDIEKYQRDEGIRLSTETGRCC